MICAGRSGAGPRAAGVAVHAPRAQLFAHGSFDLIVGVDSDGIIEGHRYAERNGYACLLSFEIFFWDELRSPYERRRKAQERDASRGQPPW